MFDVTVVAPVRLSKSRMTRLQSLAVGEFQGLLVGFFLDLQILTEMDHQDMGLGRLGKNL